MLTTTKPERYSGLRKVDSDSFAGTNADLNGVRGWSSLTGAAVIGEGAGVAYSQSGGSAVAVYSDTTGSYNKNRYVRCTVNPLAEDTAAGVVLTVGATNEKYHFLVYVVRTATNDVLYYSEQFGGAGPIGVLIENLTGFSARTLLVKRSGRKIVVECTGATRYTRTLGGVIDQTDNDPAGLYYFGPAGDPGAVNQAEWDDFLVRCYPYE